MDRTVRFHDGAAMMAASALPALPASLPHRFRTDGNSLLSAPIALAMLKADLISNADLVGIYDERTLVEAALSRWWNEKTASLQLFKWRLHIQRIECYDPRPNNGLVFCIAVQKALIPQRSLALRVEELETEHPGFGQTVLAVLYDALRYLPEAWTPLSVMGMAESVYWEGNANEDDWIATHVGHGGYASREEFLKDIGEDSLVTRAALLNGSPDWLPSAKRVCRREDLECAASSTLGKSVIAACDRIHALVHSPAFHIKPWDFLIDVPVDAAQACLFLRWHEDDALGRVIDDFMHGVFESGEYIECIAANAVDPTPEYMRQYVRNTEAMLEMAKAVEDLVLLISTPLLEVEAP